MNTQLLSEVSRSARLYPTLFSPRMQSISFRDAIVIFYKWSNVNSNFMKHNARVYNRGNGRETGASPLHFFVTVRHLLDWSVLFGSILKNVMFQDRYDKTEPFSVSCLWFDNFRKICPVWSYKSLNSLNFAN